MRWRFWHRHAHELIPDVRLELPPGPPSHTKVAFFVCRCGEADVFPTYNWNLAPEAEQQRVLKLLNITKLVVNPVIR